MFHYHSLIVGKTQLEIPPARTKRVRFFNPAFDKWTARFNLRNDLAPNLVNIGRRLICFVAGVGIAVSDSGYKILPTKSATICWLVNPKTFRTSASAIFSPQNATN